MRILLPLLLSVSLLPGWAQTKPALKPLSPIYKPDLTKWRIELTPDLGGWTTAESQDLHLKLVDPKDPAPPKEDEVRFGDEEYDDEGNYVEPPEKTADELRLQRLHDEEEAKRVAWRDRHLLIWFNGTASELFVRVGYPTNYVLNPISGENRLEILEPDSGKRLVRTWFASASRARLVISQIHAAGDDWSGNLEILEPNGDLASHGKRTTSGGTLNWSNEYDHPTPPPGTYTIRWTGGYRGGKPFRVVVEAVLDGGLDTERKWRFERLMLPGAGPATLGTIDIEN